MPPGIRPLPSIPITFHLIPVLGEIKTLERVKPSRDRMLDWLKVNIGPLFDEPFEHAAVLYNGERCDMFVGETSAINGRHIRNVRATAIYRCAALTRLVTPPPIDPESLPAISGPAVLFPDFRIWR